VRPLASEGFFRFRATFFFPAVFALFCPYDTHVPGLNEHPNTLLFISIFILRVFLERERGSGEELQGFWIGFCDRKTKARFLLSNFFSSSSVFSSLVLYFVTLIGILVVLILDCMHV